MLPDYIKYILIVMLSVTICSYVNAHDTDYVHANLATYAMHQADNAWNSIWLDVAYKGEIFDGSLDEDLDSNSKHHGYNPITDSTGGIFVILPGADTAKNRAIALWGDMENAFASGNLTGGYGVGAYHYLGRCSHLLQDMSAYPHVHPQGIDIFEHPAFENAEISYYGSYSWSMSELPMLPTDSLDEVNDATYKLDSWSASRLLSKTYSNNDVASFIDIAARITYFRSTFWGEVIFYTENGNGNATQAVTSETSFENGHIVDSKPNTLQTMFGVNNVRYINSWSDDYFEITDANSNGFPWASNWDDAWAPCEGGTEDGHVIVGGTDPTNAGVRTCGRFHFTQAYDMKPFNFPDGTSFTWDSLGAYISYYSMKTTLPYNAGLIGVGSRVLHYTLTVQSQNPGSGITIQVTPNDKNGYGSGSTTFSRTYDYGDRVTLTAPAVVSGNTFSKWLLNGVQCSAEAQMTITAKASDIYTVVYTQPLEIYTMNRSGTDTTIYWDAAGGVSYIVEWSEDMSSWTQVPVGQVGEWTDTDAGGYPKKFYRVREE